jgi:molybdenum cofactor guanylyltransferase
MSVADRPSTQMNGGTGDLSAIVLAGGQCRRMGGINKALEKVAGLTIVERIAHTLTSLFSQVILISNTPETYRFVGLPIFKDILPGNGSLGGLYTGLRHCSGEQAFLVACDMPFLNEDVIKLMKDRAAGHDVIVPRIHGMMEPLHAIYSKKCLPHIEDLLNKDDLSIVNVYSRVDVLEIDEPDLIPLDPELRFIMNVNTPEDLKEARRLAELEQRP